MCAVNSSLSQGIFKTMIVKTSLIAAQSNEETTIWANVICLCSYINWGTEDESFSIFMFVLLFVCFITNLVYSILLDPIKWNCNSVKASASLFKKTVVAEEIEDMKIQNLTPDDKHKDGICVST